MKVCFSVFVALTLESASNRLAQGQWTYKWPSNAHVLGFFALTGGTRTQELKSFLPGHLQSYAHYLEMQPELDCHQGFQSSPNFT